MSGKIEEMMNHAKIAELLNKKKAEEENKNFVLWLLAIVGAVAAVAAIAFAVYRYMNPKYADFDGEFDYDEFEELMEKEEFIRFDICQHKKNRGICVESEGVLLSKEEEGNFFCVMKMIKDVQAKEDDALEFAVLWYGKTNSGALKLRCYSHDKDYFDMFYVLGEECGSYGRS